MVHVGYKPNRYKQICLKTELGVWKLRQLNSYNDAKLLNSTSFTLHYYHL